MVCRHCRNKHHDRCEGGTWCDCQHRNVVLIGHPDAGKTELALAAGDNDETEPEKIQEYWVDGPGSMPLKEW